MAMVLLTGMSFWLFAYNEAKFRIVAIVHSGVLRGFGVWAWNVGSWWETFVLFVYFTLL